MNLHLFTAVSEANIEYGKSYQVIYDDGNEGYNYYSEAGFHPNITPNVAPSRHVFKMDERKITHVLDLSKLTTKEKVLSMLHNDNSGRAGCTYGDTEYDSESAVFGYNVAIDNVREKVSKL